MTTPRCVKLNKPDVFRAIHHLIKCRVCQSYNIFVGAAAISVCRPSRRRPSAFLLLLCTFGSAVDRGDNLVKRELSDAFCVSASTVVNWLGFIVSEEFESGEALDVVRGPNTLMFVHVDRSYFDYTFEVLGS